MFTKTFWKQALERATKSAVQAVLGLGILDGANVLHFDWKLAGATALGAFVVSVLTSLVSLPFGQSDSPSTVSTTE